MPGLHTPGAWAHEGHGPNGHQIRQAQWAVTPFNGSALLWGLSSTVIGNEGSGTVSEVKSGRDVTRGMSRFGRHVVDICATDDVAAGLPTHGGCAQMGQGPNGHQIRQPQ